MKPIYRIFPTIGIARIGKSDFFYIGPESPTMLVQESFKENGKIKRQGARFRIYEFEVDEFGREEVRREVTNSANTRIEWTVELANKKAAANAFPPGGQTIKRNPGYDLSGLRMSGKESLSGNNARSALIEDDIKFIKDGFLEGKAKVELGHLETDDAGRLIVIGGNGDSKSPLGLPITEFANNRGWYDDLCDGPVTATISIDGGTPVDAESAWVVIASPAFAPEIRNVVTWYDQAENVVASYFDPSIVLNTPSFTKDIYPILKSTVLLQWVSSRARRGHGSGRPGDFLAVDKLSILADNSDAVKREREKVLSRLIIPGSTAPSFERMAPRPKSMPNLRSGVNPENPSESQYPSLTDYQYGMMEKWAEGDFHPGFSGEPAPVAFDDIPLAEQPQALIKAALDGCIGGPFFPGIESTYLMALRDTYEKPYKINTEKSAGFLTEKMALPWQADYLSCGILWWPAQRPVSVDLGGGNFEDFSRGINSWGDMVKDWNQLGFIVKSGNDYIERERDTIS